MSEQHTPGPLEPLPCPFCGSDPKWLHHATGSQPTFTEGIQRVWEWQAHLHCDTCRLPSCSGFGNVAWQGGNALAHQHAMQRAVRQWNRRSVPVAAIAKTTECVMSTSQPDKPAPAAQAVAWQMRYRFQERDWTRWSECADLPEGKPIEQKTGPLTLQFRPLYTNPSQDAAVVTAARALLRYHLDEAEVHPCDVNNDRVRAAHCIPEAKKLFDAFAARLKEQP